MATEKIKTVDSWTSGYFKPSGKKQKRSIHKKIRRMDNLDTNKKGIYNRIGVHWEWC